MKATTNVLFLGLFLVVSSLFGQDTIVKTGGYEIPAKVLIVSDSVVKYKRFDNPDGPTYIINKNDVLLIKYENGTKDILGISGSIAANPEELTYKNTIKGIKIYHKDKMLTDQDVRIIYENFAPEAIPKFNAGKGLTTTGTIIGVSGGLVFTLYMIKDIFVHSESQGSYTTPEESNKKIYIYSGIGIGAGILISGVGREFIRRSVKIYNGKNRTNHTAINLRFRFTNFGPGLCLSF